MLESLLSVSSLAYARKKQILYLYFNYPFLLRNEKPTKPNPISSIA